MTLYCCLGVKNEQCGRSGSCLASLSASRKFSAVIRIGVGICLQRFLFDKSRKKKLFRHSPFSKNKINLTIDPLSLGIIAPGRQVEIWGPGAYIPRDKGSMVKLILFFENGEWRN